MPRPHGLIDAALALGAAGFLATVAAQAPDRKPPVPANQQSFEKTVLPIIAKNCLGCHSGEEPIGGLRLDLVKTREAMSKDRETWDRVAAAISTGVMPPKGRPPLTPDQRKTVSTWITTALSEDCDVASPGSVTMRRLNRLEYNNTIRDLTGLDLHLADDFPSDDVGYGFDNIGDVLSISPLLMEKYLQAAEIVSHRAIYVPSSGPTRFDGPKLKLDDRANLSGAGDVLMFSNSEAAIEQYFPFTGEYRVRIGAYGQQAGNEPTRLALNIDGKRIATFDVKETQAAPGTFEAKFNLTKGRHRIGAAFINDFYQAGPPRLDRNLVVQFVDLVTPNPSYEELPESHRRIIPATTATINPATRARTILATFARKAYRRPPTSVEIDRLVEIAGMAWKDGEPFEQGIRLGVQATLSSPHFLFRVEKESAAEDLGAYELASRLSYFIWASMPDDRLLTLAEKGSLTQPQVLEAEAKRMLKDPKAAAMGEAFASQWLNLRKLSLIQPDPTLFPGFNEPLRQSMMTETRMFFDYVVKEDRKITDFLQGKYTFIDERLARHYGIPGVEGDEFRKVSLDGIPRGGLLTQGAILTLTSNPTRTSPVKRGKWVLEQILNQPPPPPPPGVPDLVEEHDDDGTPKTIREQMAAHLKNPVCASCHTRMDPIGLGMENFDAVGRWRAEADGKPIDSYGELPDGSKFDGPTELRAVLIGKTREFNLCLAEKMLTYATGRGMESSDKCFVEEVADKVEKNDYKFSSLVCAVVTSEPFRKRSSTGTKK